MGFFSGKRQPAPSRPPAPDKSDKGASITLLLAAGAPELARLEADLRTVTGDPAARIGSMLDGVLPGAPPLPADSSGAFSVSTAGVRVRCMRIEAPAPGLDQMIQFTRRPNEELAGLLRHTSHILCFAEGGDGLAQTTVLFQIAHAMADQGVIGLIHTPAWQCFLMDQVAMVMQPDMLAALRKDMAKALWCNLIPFHGQGGSWFATKGNHIFGIPDFALWNAGQMQAGEIHGLMQYLFDYVQKGAVLAHGQTLNLPNHVMRIGPVTEYHDYIAGGGETIALRFE